MRNIEYNNIEMYSTYNQGKSVFGERFIKTLKSRVYKCMTSISRNVYNDKLDDIVNRFNYTYYRTIKMKSVDVKNNTYIDFGKKVNDKNPKFKIGDHVKMSKYKKVFAKGYNPNWSEEVYVAAGSGKIDFYLLKCIVEQ